MLLASFCFSAPNGTAGVIQWDSGGGWEKFYPITPMKHHKNVRDSLQNTTPTHAMVQGSDGQCDMPLSRANCTQLLQERGLTKPLSHSHDLAQDATSPRMNTSLIPVGNAHTRKAFRCTGLSEERSPFGERIPGKGQVTLQGAVDDCLLTGTGNGFTAKNMTNRTILTIEMDLTPVPCRAKRFTPRAYACGVSGSDRDTCVRPSTPRLRPSRRDPTVAGGDAFLIRTNYMPYTTVGRFYMNRSHAKACRFSHVAERATASTYDRYNAGTSRGRAPRFADSNLVASWWARAQVAILTVAGSKCGARQVLALLVLHFWKRTAAAPVKPVLSNASKNSSHFGGGFLDQVLSAIMLPAMITIGSITMLSRRGRGSRDPFMVNKAPETFSEQDHETLNDLIFGGYLKTCSCVERFRIEDGVADLLGYCNEYWGDENENLMWPNNNKPIRGFRGYDFIDHPEGVDEDLQDRDSAIFRNDDVAKAKKYIPGLAVIMQAITTIASHHPAAFLHDGKTPRKAAIKGIDGLRRRGSKSDRGNKFGPHLDTWSFKGRGRFTKPGLTFVLFVGGGKPPGLKITGANATFDYGYPGMTACFPSGCSHSSMKVPTEETTFKFTFFVEFENCEQLELERYRTDALPKIAFDDYMMVDEELIGYGMTPSQYVKDCVRERPELHSGRRATKRPAQEVTSTVVLEGLACSGTMKPRRERSPSTHLNLQQRPRPRRLLSATFFARAMTTRKQFSTSTAVLMMKWRGPWLKRGPQWRWRTG